jgi:tryptophan synthase beta subunit
MNQQKSGYYGRFGGRYMPEILMAPVYELEQAFAEIKNDPAFNQTFIDQLQEYAGRPTPLTKVPRFAEAIGGPEIYLKREDLLHTGAHKINNALGQCLLAKKLGKHRIIAETGAGQHGVAVATACARLGLDCVVYMGAIDAKRQAPNVARMNLLGAKVVAVKNGSQTLKDAVNEALRDWSESFELSHYCLGSALGPSPYPEMVAHFHAIIGREAKEQCLKQIGSLPDMVIACVGGGSNAIGIFSAFIDDKVKLIGVEAGGSGDHLGEHAARLLHPSLGVFHGCYSYLLQDDEGQVATTHSIAAGLDYPMIGPAHAWLYETKRAQYVAVSDDQAVAALKLLTKTEGIIPALESSHALAYVSEIAKTLDKQTKIVVNLSGRGDKDLPQLFDLKK